MKTRWCSLLVGALMMTTTACGVGGGNSSGSNGSNNGGSSGNSVGSGNGSKTVVVSTLFAGEAMKEAIRQYEAKHPNVSIELNYVQDADKWGPQDLEDYVKRTSTGLLAGKGPDIVYMDPLPLGKFIKAKALADIGAMMDKDASFAKGDYFANVFAASKIGGGLYSVPTGFGLSALLGDEEAIRKAGVKLDDGNWSWSEFNETAKQLVKRGGYNYAFAGFPPQDMLTEMVTENAPAFIDDADRKAKFDSAAFTGLLKQVKAMYDNRIVAAGEGGIAKAYFSPIYINSAQEYFALPKVMYAKGRLYRKPGIGGSPQQAQTGTGGYFYTNMSFGISEMSPVKDEAWSFVKFLLSEDMQGMPDRSRGFPLNKKVLDKQMQQLVDEGAVQVAYGPNKGKKVEVTEADAKQLEQLLSEAGRPLSNNDRVLKEMVAKESEAFFAGQKSAEDVAKLLQNRVTTYLNE